MGNSEIITAKLPTEEVNHVVIEQNTLLCSGQQTVHEQFLENGDTRIIGLGYIVSGSYEVTCPTCLRMLGKLNNKQILQRVGFMFSPRPFTMFN